MSDADRLSVFFKSGPLAIGDTHDGSGDTPFSDQRQNVVNIPQDVSSNSVPRRKPSDKSEPLMKPAADNVIVHGKGGFDIISSTESAKTSSEPSRGRPFRMAHGASTWMTRGYSYPLIYCSPEGTLSLMLRSNVIIEMTVDRTIRAICPGKFAAASNARANSSCIMHPQARVYQEDAKVFSSFADEKQAVIGAEGIVFTMRPLNQAYLVSSQKVDGTLPFPKQSIRFPELPRDATLSLLYSSDYGSHLYNDCYKIVQKAQYEQTDAGGLNIAINGMSIRQSADGDVEIQARPRFMSLSPAKNTVVVRTHYVHMGIQEGNASFIKRGVKRVHVSPSGMVVSDGNCTTSLDYLGNIVSSS